MHFYQIFAISKIILLIIIIFFYLLFFFSDVYPSISLPKMTSITEQRGESNTDKQKLYKQIYSYVIHIYTIDNRLLFLIRFQLSHYVFEFSPLEITSFPDIVKITTEYQSLIFTGNYLNYFICACCQLCIFCEYPIQYIYLFIYKLC